MKIVGCTIMIKQLFVVAIFLLFPQILVSQVSSDQWSAEDALGRRTISYEEAGPKREGKYIGMFYWTWHTDGLAEWVMPDGSIANTTEIITNNPGAEDDPDHSAWQNVWDGGVFWWDEPLFGYYRTTDTWVLRKHAEMLADAGVDVVFFDCTNGNFTWKSSYTVLLETWAQAREDGVNTPKISFLLPFGPTTGSKEAIAELYTDLYSQGKYQDLWFYWKGKPLLMAYSDNLYAEEGETAGMVFTADSAFTGISVICPSWSNNIGNLTLTLYQWTSSGYDTSVSGTPLAQKEFINFEDNATLRLDFNELPAGSYVWELSDATEVVGVWKNPDSTDPVQSYFNGDKVSGNYESDIYFADGTSSPLGSRGTSHVPVQIHGTVIDVDFDAIRDFFTFRPGQPDYVSGPSRSDQWGWLEVFPQHGYAGTTYEGFEEVTVGVGQNATDLSGGRCNNFNAPGSYGRSYTQTNKQDTSANAYLYGANIQEQWSRAYELDPELVFVTGWNEWVAGRWKNWPGCAGNPEGLVMGFPDQYNWDKSRDLEPVKAWGNKGDVYYLQFVNNVRRFKGMEAPQKTSDPKIISLGNLNEWDDVMPEYNHYKGNTIHRDHKGQGPTLTYSNTTGRNDIVKAKVARDTENVYFYVETTDVLTDKSDSNWMRLFIDIDRDKSTGWEGYDFIFNRVSPLDSVIVEKSVNSWSWEKVGSAAYKITNNVLEIKIDKKVLNINSDTLNFEFKWSDNSITDGDIMDFYVNGDAAPGGRFNFVYNTAIITSLGSMNEMPNKFYLEQNYPNPFGKAIPSGNPSTTIKYSVPVVETRHSVNAGQVTPLVHLVVYDILGKEVATLVNAYQPAGEYEVVFNAENLPSGTYFYKLESGTFSETKKLLLLK